ncbi:MAG: hypothetical protein Q7T82_07690, partial [Armatimonadota bacterium]|nr:hypothetical protein [Armatimonadota bacterium]
MTTTMHKTVTVVALVFTCAVGTFWTKCACAVGNLSGALTKNAAPMSSPYAPFVDVIDSNYALHEQSTDPGGQYSIPGLPDGPASVDAFASGDRYIGHRDVDILPSQTVTADFDWSVGAVSGHVARNGVPLSGARIDVADSNNNWYQATTNGSGDYSISDVTAGVANVYCHDAGGLFLGFKTATVSRNGVATVNFDVLATGSVAGTVTKNGSAAAGARIDILDFGGNWHTRTIGPSGGYTISGVAAGAGTAYCYSPDGALIEARGILVPDGGTATINFAWSTGTIQGTVTKTGGTPVEGALLRTGRGESGNTNASGFYSFEAVSGQTTLTCYSPDWYEIGSATPDVPAGGAITVDFTWGVGTVRGAVTKGPNPLPYARVEIVASDAQTHTAIANSDGTYEAQGVAAGPASATAWTADGHWIGQRSGSVPAGGEVTLDFNWTGVIASPDPFVPTGASDVTTVIDLPETPSQTGLTLDIVCDTTGWRWSSYNGRISLTETPSGSGNYRASWTAFGNSPAGQMVWPDDDYRFEVFDSLGQSITGLEGQVSVTGVSSVSPSPSVITPGVDSTLIAVASAPSLQQLQARVTRAGTTYKTLALAPTESQGALSASWNGTNESSAYVAGGNYTLQVWNADTGKRYYPTATLHVRAGVTLIAADPNPFSPTGVTPAVITIHANPNQPDMSIEIAEANVSLSPTETPAGSGIYVASWNGKDSGLWLAQDGSYTLEVYDQDGNQDVTTGSISVSGVSGLYVNPALFDPDRRSSSVTAYGAPGLTLQARFKSGSTYVRGLDLVEGPTGVYAGSWDGHNDGGTDVAAGVYNVEVWNSAGAARYHPAATVKVVWNTRILHVKADGSDSADGLSWTTAKQTVSAALTDAVGGDEIWVASAEYAERITLKNDVGLYGGFAGGETARDERDWTTHPTVLDGGQGGSVVTAPNGVTTTAVIDGFTIRNGAASSGGGIYSYYGYPTISNNQIVDNTATSNGGGIYCSSGSPVIANNVLVGNSAGSYGGGVYVSSSSPWTVANNVVGGNSADYGGGVYCYGPGLLANNTITDNFAPEYSGYVGGGVYLSYSSNVVNNIIAFNTSGLYRYGSTTPTLSHNCVYGNTVSDYSGITDPTGSDGNIKIDPQLVSVSGSNAHILPASPCRD